MVNGKLNIVADERKKSLEYNFAGVDVEIKGVLQSTGTIRWGAESSLTLEQQFDRKEKAKPGPEPKKKEAAKRWLGRYLADGPRPNDQLLIDGKAAGHAEWTIRAAAKEMRITSEPQDGVYVWALPMRDVIDVAHGEVY